MEKARRLAVALVLDPVSSVGARAGVRDFDEPTFLECLKRTKRLVHPDKCAGFEDPATKAFQQLGEIQSDFGNFYGVGARMFPPLPVEIDLKEALQEAEQRRAQQAAGPRSAAAHTGPPEHPQPAEPSTTPGPSEPPMPGPSEPSTEPGLGRECGWPVL